MTIMFTPNKDDMMRMVKAFVSIHHEVNHVHIKDDIGPNAPDAPFFKRVATMDAMDEEDYIEMSERFRKYIGTQLPAIMKIAGYPTNTDWARALDALHQIGEEAKTKRLAREKIQREYARLLHKGKKKMQGYVSEFITEKGSKSTFTPLSDSELKFMKGELLDMGIDVAAVNELVDGANENGLNKLASIKSQFSLDVEEYEEVWYSKNDYQQRYPRKSKRLKLVWKGRNTKLYYDLKEAVPFPSFKYQNYTMSCSLDSMVIEKVSSILSKHGYDTSKLDVVGVSLKTTEPKTNSSGYAVRLKGDALFIKLPYNDTTCRNVIKGLNGRRWVPDAKQWTVPISEANVLIKKLKEAGDWSDTPASLLTELKGIGTLNDYLKGKAERIAISSATTLTDDALVKDMKERLSVHFPADKELYPFQYAGVRFAELADGRCLIGDDMGIGKTMQAIAYAALHEEYWPVLVVCPANVKYNWLKEIQTWLPDVTVQAIKTGTQDIDDTSFTVINYDLAKRQEERLHELDANLIIFDESHYLKNSKAQRTQACVALAEGADSVLCLSGTAITNRPVELFTTLEMIRPAEYKGNFFQYGKRYCGAEHNGYGWDFTGASNISELHEKLRDCMIRRLKKEVLTELPDKVRQFIPVVPNQKEMAAYKRTHRQWLTEYAHHKAEGSVPLGFVLNMLTDLRHHAGTLKVGATIDWVGDYKEQNEDKPIIVFYHHKDVGAGLLSMMENDKRFNHKRWRVIAGGTPSIKRQEYVEQFQAGMLDGLLCSTIAAKEGLTLTAADTTVFVEREWVPGWEEQAEDRICRIGATGDTVWATYLSVVGTIDEKFDRIVEAKREITSAILDGGEVGEDRAGIAVALLEAMVEAGEIPADMLKHMGGSKPKSHDKKEEEE